MKSTTNNSKRTKTMLDSDQHHHYHHHQEEDGNEENIVNDNQSGHHIHHHHHFHYHHHHHHHNSNNNDSKDNEEHKPIVQPNPARAPPRVNFQPGIRIQCKLDSNSFLSIIDEKLVLAPSNADDKRQRWDIHRDNTRKDEMGKSAFVLVNKATAQAIRHGYHTEGGSCYVELLTYNPEAFDAKLLWVHDVEVEEPSYDGYRSLCPYGHILFNLNASTCYGGSIGCPYSEDVGPYQLWMFLID